MREHRLQEQLKRDEKGGSPRDILINPRDRVVDMAETLASNLNEQTVKSLIKALQARLKGRKS